MNSTLLGRHRDEQIIQLISNGHAFSTRQIEQIIFSGKKDARRITQKRLHHLWKTERLKRVQKDPFLPAIYYITKPKYLTHALMINDVYCALITQRPQGCTLDIRWSYSVMDGMVFCDLLVILYALPDKKGKHVFFIEVERAPSKRFDKPEKYLSVYRKTWYKEEWATLVNDGKSVIFPNIIIVTDEPLTIKSELKFIVATPAEIQKDVYSVLRR